MRRYSTINRALLAASALTAPVAAQAQDTAPSGSVAAEPTEIIVTAQKRDQNIQDVPISIQAITSKKLDDLNIKNFNDYTKLLPSVSFQTAKPGQTTVYVRGVASGGDGQHAGSLPSVGTYLNEQPITTIGGTLDVHIYDVARIEALSGPQGTLFGASSESGTVRIITNRPDTSGFYGRVDASADTVAHGGQGGSIDAFLNIPLGESVAVRLVGFYERDAGFIDNVFGQRQFLKGLDVNGQPDPNGLIVNNSGLEEKDYNPVDTYGGRAALKIDLDANWTVQADLLGQEQKADGSFGYDANLPGLKVQHFTPEYSTDRFLQAALTINGKISNWDLTYAGAYMLRRVKSSSDFSDYSVAYDQAYASYGGLAGFFYFYDNAGNMISSIQPIIGDYRYSKLSQELRIASPATDPLRLVAGLFYQRQSNLDTEVLPANGLADALSVPGYPNAVWLTKIRRVDRDYAAFGEVSYDLTRQLTLTGGLRYYKYDNTLIGFVGYGRNPDGPPFNPAGSSRTGVAGCYTADGSIVRSATGAAVLAPAIDGSPCTNVGTFSNGSVVPKQAEGDGFIHRLNATWKIDGDRMVYATWSRGFRPGGINRRVSLAPYAPDHLVNYELGFKTKWANGAVRWNGAFFRQDWKNFQYSFLGQNGFTEIHNGPNARIDGFETDVTLVPARGLAFTTTAAYLDGKLRSNLCAYDDLTYTCSQAGPNGQANSVVAPAGTRLPVTSKYKLNSTARYEFPIGADVRAHVQSGITFQSKASSVLRLADPADPVPILKAYEVVDAAAGADFGKISAELFVTNLFDVKAPVTAYMECGKCTFRPYYIILPPRTLGLRLGYSF